MELTTTTKALAEGNEEKTRPRDLIHDGGREDSETTTEATASRWRAWVIVNNDGGVGRERWARVIDNNNGGIGGGSRRDNTSKWTSPTAETAVCLWAQVIDNNDGGVGRLRWAHGLSDDNIIVDRGRVIYDASEVLKTTTEAARARVIYDDDGGVGRGRWAQRIQQQQQRRRRRRIYYASKGLETMTEAAVARRRARWIVNNNGVLIFLAIALLTVTLSCLYLVTDSFLYCFRQIPFLLFTAINTISTAIIQKIFLYQVYTNLAYVPPTYRRVKKLRVLMTNKDIRRSLARKNRNYILIWSYNNPG